MNQEITIKQAVAEGRYGSASTIRRRVRDGSVRARKEGGRLRLNVGDLEALTGNVVALGEEAYFQRLARQVADAAPELSAERCEELRRLLAM